MQLPFHPAVVTWFEESFERATDAQRKAWPAIAKGEHTLVFAPTGSGKTLAAFLACLDRLMFFEGSGCRALYVSPLKALASDVERNLRAPLAGIARVAERRGDTFRMPAVSQRTGDTPQTERARFKREPSDILITTPESLYLLLTSQAKEALRQVETVIIDEIHALVPSKRGAHLMVSLERLQALCARPPQRIGLSATQRPLDEVARFLGGAERSSPEGEVSYRPVSICDAGAKKRLRLSVEMHEAPEGDESIWAGIQPRLLALVRAHRSTLVFVNSRRIAERLSAALNELAGETIAYAHHGSLARTQRTHIEDLLKDGRVPALICTSSLELGIDMGAIDLVVLVEAPPSVASALQRIGRAAHHVGGESKGLVFPKYKGDLLACAALTRAMEDGAVESTSYPRNPLDVLAQHIVAMSADEAWTVDALFETIRHAAPFATISRPLFESTLDMLSGRYASDELSDLKPRVVWDRIAGTVLGRQGAKRIAIASGGTIPDRGLYGVFLAGAEKANARVGELDEEMVFESRRGEVFLLGASSWRIEEITHDRVVVSPAPGAPGKMPFWRGDSATRPLELGQKIGALTRAVRTLPRSAARALLEETHSLDAHAAELMLSYIDEQASASDGVVPDDRTIVIERSRDELGDWRVCVLSPFGGKVFAPWTMAITANVRLQRDADVEAMWTNDGFVLRFAETQDPPESDLLLIEPEALEQLVVSELGSSALFAARFRESAARALLLPKRRPGQRTPLWQQRKRASDLLAVAARYPAFPIVLEAYRECMRDVFDLPALMSLMRDIRERRVRVVVRDTDAPSPFASALLFGYVANYIYEGDAPIAERRAQALTIDQAQLKDLLGEGELRELLDADVMDLVESALQQREPERRARHKDAVHDMLLRLGDLSHDELLSRCESEAVAKTTAELITERRVLVAKIGGHERYLAIEDTGRYRDALGVVPPRGVPQAFLEAREHPLREIFARYARTHAPFTAAELAARYALAPSQVERELQALVHTGRLLEGAFRPHGQEREYSDPEVLRTIRRRSLAKLRKEVEPVPPSVYVRMLVQWHGVHRPRRGLDAVLDAIDKLQGAPLAASLVESELLPARVLGYELGMLDQLLAAGEVLWCGVEPLGERDGRVALYLSDHLAKLWRGPSGPPEPGLEETIFAFLERTGASFFASIQQGTGGRFAAEVLDALWSLVWKGWVTNDTFRAARAYAEPSETSRKPRPGAFRSRRASPPSGEGRWSLVNARLFDAQPSDTQKAAATAEQWLQRYGLVMRDVAAAEAYRGGFSAIADVYRALEDKGRIRRGYFVSDVPGMQFATPAAVDLLRALRVPPDQPQAVILAATDPANPFGALLRWPEHAQSLSRSVGATVIIVDGELRAYLPKASGKLATWLPASEPERGAHSRAVALALKTLAEKRSLLLSEIDGASAAKHVLAKALGELGFGSSPQGLYLARARY